MKNILCVILAILCLAGCATAPSADFVITSKPIGQPIAGFGACMNPYLYTYPNMPDEISEEQVKDLEAKVKALRPQFVRIFFLNSWWESDTDASIAKGKPGMRQSLIRTIRLAQDSGATVLLQFWYDPDRYTKPDDVTRRFAQAIADLREKHGLTSIRYATIQNEPNEFDHDITKEQYVRVYRAFDRALRDLGLRDKIKIIGGDLVGEHYERWFKLLGGQLSPILEGYSIHTYWDYWNIGTFRRHVEGVNATLAKMPPRQRRPIYVTEFGARGFRDKPSIEPGKSTDGKPVADVPTYTFEIAIFMLEAINSGYLGTAQWDLYEVWYDRKMGYGVIGSVEKGFPLKPGYHLLQMFTQHTRPGWRAMKIDGQVEDVWISTLRGKAPGGGLSVFVINRVRGEKEIKIAGLPRQRRLNVWIWNGDGTGALKMASPIMTSADGTVAITLSEMSVALLTTTEPPPMMPRQKWLLR